MRASSAHCPSPRSVMGASSPPPTTTSSPLLPMKSGGLLARRVYHEDDEDDIADQHSMQGADDNDNVAANDEEDANDPYKQLQMPPVSTPNIPTPSPQGQSESSRPRRRGVPTRSKSSDDALRLLQQQVLAAQQKQQQLHDEDRSQELGKLSSHTISTVSSSCTTATSSSTSVFDGCSSQTPPTPTRTKSHDSSFLVTLQARSNHHHKREYPRRRAVPSRSKSSDHPRHHPDTLSDSCHRATTVKPSPLALSMQQQQQQDAAATSTASLASRSAHARLVREQEELLTQMNASLHSRQAPARRRPRARSHNSCDGVRPSRMNSTTRQSAGGQLRRQQKPRQSSAPQEVPHFTPEDYAKLLSSTADKEATHIEIAPGTTTPLLGAADTWKAVAHDNYVPTSCVGCNMEICCILSASCVLCPSCKTVSPLDCGDATAGSVGLGFTLDDLLTIQNEIMAHRGGGGH